MDFFRRLIAWLIPALQLAEKRGAAAHKAGHVLLAWFSPHVLRVTSASLSSAEVTWFIRDIKTPENMFDQIMIHLGGLAGVSVVLGGFRSKPASTDLLRARECAAIICRQPDWRCRLSRLKKTSDRKTVDFAAMFKEPPSPDVCRVLDSAFAAARSNILDFRDAHTRVMQALLERGRLDEAEIAALFGPRLWVI